MHRNDSLSRTLLAAFLILLIAPVTLIYLGQNSNLDLTLADSMFDSASQSFPWRHAWLTETFMHNGLRRVLTVMACIPVILCLRDLVWRKYSWPPSTRARIQTIALSAVIVPLTISTLKQFSNSHCPWDIDRYGGLNPYVRLLDVLPLNATPGQCLPAGHASSALWLLSIAVIWWPHRPRIAAFVSLVMLAVGFALGWAQQMRGAHFLTHTLWSMWIACVIVPCLFIVVERLNKVRLVIPQAPPNELQAIPIKVKDV